MKTIIAKKAMTYSFSQKEFETAIKEWNCNCGPTALAFALQVSLDAVHPVIPDFDKKHYTSPTMMKAALASLGRKYEQVEASKNTMFDKRVALVRVQWTGPWTDEGANPKWAYRETHWIATWGEDNVFDCNGGMIKYDDWVTRIVPMLINLNKRAYGGWFPTHVWRI